MASPTDTCVWLILGDPAVRAFGGADALAISIIVAGMLCQFWHRRLPKGLGTSLFVCATTVGTAMAAYRHAWPQLHLVPETQARHLAALLAGIFAALWSFFGWLAARGRRQSTRTPTSSATFFAWSLVSGIAAIVMIAYMLAFATWPRILNPPLPADGVTAVGMWVLLFAILATLFWTSASPRPQQPVMLLALAALLVWWTGLMIPSGVGAYPSTARPIVSFQPMWWTWLFHIQCGFAALLVGAAVLQEWHYRARRRRAWPDRLDDLLEPYSRWNAYIQAEATIAAGVLVIGVFQIVRPFPIGWQLNLANFIVCTAAGATCMFMTYRRWSGNTAGLGIALVTLSVVALACLITMSFTSAVEYAFRVPTLDNAVLCAMALMILHWNWLAGVWDQQLLNGVPWTTTGRMIPHTRRAVLLITALAALVAFHMALWPMQVASNVVDNSTGRQVAGIGVILALAVIAGWRARKTDSPSDALFSVAFIIAAVAFFFIRMPASAMRGWLIQYEPLVLSSLCLPILLAAEGLHDTKWRGYSTPLWLLALLILPLRTLIRLLEPQRLPAEWIQPSTLALLGAVYLLAGRREKRRAVLVLGGVLMLAALTTFFRSYGRVIITAISD
jgi:hypothetical protein